MQIGSKVKSRLYASKGVGTIISFNSLFKEQYAEILFKDGSTVTTKINDLITEDDPVSQLQNGSIEHPFIFFTRQMVLRLHANISENTIITSTNYKIQPLPHQLLAVNFVMNRFQPRSLIADEVGLGKTIEAILVYQEFKLRGIVKKILIVVPSGIVLQWHEELLSKFNEHFVIYTKEYIRTLKQSYGEETNVWKLHEKIIASIDSIKPIKIDDDLEPVGRKRKEWHNKNIFEDITTAGFDIVIIDEAHKLSKYGDGHESARFKLGEKLSEAVPVLLLLTATPHQGDEHLFINLLRLIDPILFTSTKSLIPELVKEVAVRNKKRAAVDFNGDRIFKHRITSLIEINRIKTDQQEEIELYDYVTEYTAKYYNLAKRTNNQILIFLVMLYQRIVSSSSFALLDAMKRRKSYLENQLLEIYPANKNSDEEEFDIDDLLRKVTFTEKQDIEVEKQFVETCISLAQNLTKSYKEIKFRKIIEIIDEIKKREQNPDLKFIIFTEFRATQDAIINFLTKFGYSCSYINGSLSRDEKSEQVQQFRSNTQIMVSTDAGGEGINLQFCYCMINFDLPWNPSRLEQRIGRVDRIGQIHNALIFNFHLVDTIEDRVRQKLEIKLSKIKEQFGEDKYTDVLNLLQDEFSFDKIYLDAIQLKEFEDRELDKIAEKIFQRANVILEKDELLLPFSKFNQDAKNLINSELNTIIEKLVLQYLKFCNIPINIYKDESDFFYFNNPFQLNEDDPTVFRNVTFKNEFSTKKEKVEFINFEHPLVTRICQEIEKDGYLGTVSVFKVDLNKFQGINGFWFIYQLTIKNNIDKSKTNHISVFMEDKDFENNRISQYLNEHILDEVNLIQNYENKDDLAAISNSALKIAEEKANEIFTATSLMWINEINEYEKKFEDYFKFKENAFKRIQIDNIREAKLKSLDRDKQEQTKKFQLQRNIVPKLELYQIAYLEFI
ncbi:MAG: DEAD/DEAH box helicase [Candidatus Thorarchaeota archaeon]